MPKPKWKQTYEALKETGDTIACEFQSDGTLAYYMSRAGKSINLRTIRKLESEGLIRPFGLQIDPEIPTAYEAA